MRRQHKALPRPPCPRFCSCLCPVARCMFAKCKQREQTQAKLAEHKASSLTHTHTDTHTPPSTLSLLPDPLSTSAHLWQTCNSLSFCCFGFFMHHLYNQTHNGTAASALPAVSLHPPSPLFIGSCWLEFDVCSFIIHFALTYITPPSPLFSSSSSLLTEPVTLNFSTFRANVRSFWPSPRPPNPSTTLAQCLWHYARHKA